jgi:hypothetical protein
MLIIERETVTTTRIYKVDIEQNADDYDAVRYRNSSNLLNETPVTDIEFEFYEIK